MLPLVLLLALSAARAEEASLILHSGKVFLGPGRRAQAVAVSGNRFLKAGSDKAILALRGKNTKVVDLKGRTATPGLQDAHLEPLEAALRLGQADLRGAKTLEQVQERLRAFTAARPGDGWVVAFGWDRSAWEGLPARADLDLAVSTRPAAVWSVEGTTLWLNSEGVRRAGITSRTPTFNKGDILRDKAGQPTGLLLGQATNLGRKAITLPDRAVKKALLLDALAELHAAGVTSAHAFPSPSGPPEELLSLWEELHKEGRFPLRLVLYGRLEDPAGLAALRKAAAPFPRSRLLVFGAATTLDGVVAERAAALLGPYFDEPKRRGELTYAPFTLQAMTRLIHEQGLQAAFAASGDAAVREALDACAGSMESARRAGTVLPAVPCRVERAELVAETDLPRFGTLKAGAAVQPARLTFKDEVANRFPNILGDRARSAFPLRGLETGGAVLAFASGWPSGRLEPRYALHAAVTRRNLDGRPAGGWLPAQRVDLESALLHYTRDAARLVGREEESGEIVPGRLADLVVWDRDLFAAAPEDLLEARPLLTVFDGAVVFEKKP